MAEPVEVGQKRALRDEELEAPEAKQARQDGQVNSQAGVVTAPAVKAEPVAAPQAEAAAPAAAPAPGSVQADAAEVLAVATQSAPVAAAPAAPAAQGTAAAASPAAAPAPAGAPAAGSRPPPRQPIGPDGQPLPFKLSADVILKQEIPMPRRMASCVIGVRGTTVTRLRRESGTKIHVRQGGPQENEQVVEIEGTIDAVVNCMRLIEDILATEDPSYRMPPKPHVTSRFMVTSDMVGPAIIGKQGTHAKHVRERTGVKIEVERAQDGDNRQSILLIGKADGVREAYHILLNNIRKYGTNLPAGAVPPPMTIPRTGAYAASGRTPTAAAATAPPPPPRSYSPEVRRNTYGAPPPPPNRGYRAEDTYQAADAYQAPDAYQPPPPPTRGGAPAAADPYAAYAAQVAAPAAAATYAAPAAAAPAAAPAAGAPGQPPVIYLMGPNGQLIPAVVRYETAAATGATAAAAAPAAGATATYAAQPQYQQVMYQQPAQAQTATASYTVADPNAAAGTAAAAGAQQGSYLQAGLLQQLLQQGTSAAQQQQPAAAATTTSAAQVAAGYSMGGTAAGQQLQFQGYSTAPQGQVQYQTAQAAQPGTAAAPAAGQYGSTGFVQYTYATQ